MIIIECENGADYVDDTQIKSIRWHKGYRTSNEIIIPSKIINGFKKLFGIKLTKPKRKGVWVEAKINIIFKDATIQYTWTSISNKFAKYHYDYVKKKIEQEKTKIIKLIK